MKYCSRHNFRVMVCEILQNPFLALSGTYISTIELIKEGYEWKQLVLPGFDLIMGV